MRERSLLARTLDGWPAVLGLLLIVGIWQGSVTAFRLPHYVLPGLDAILARMVTERSVLFDAMLMTAAEALGGFFIGSLLGLALAILLTLLPRLERAVMPLIVGINSVPVVAYAPLMLIWFGNGPASKVAMASLAVGFVVLLNALQGLKATDPAAIALLKSFGAGTLRIMTKLRLPMAMPAVVNGLRVGIVRSVLITIVSEMLGAYKGLGWTIYESTQQTDFLRVWAAVFTASAMSVTLYAILVAIDRRLVWWK